MPTKPAAGATNSAPRLIATDAFLRLCTAGTTGREDRRGARIGLVRSSHSRTCRSTKTGSLVEFLAVVLVEFPFGIASAPFGLALGLPLPLVVVGVSTGCRAFAGIAPAGLWRMRGQLVARRPGWVGAAVPVAGWVW